MNGQYLLAIGLWLMALSFGVAYLINMVDKIRQDLAKIKRHIGIKE